MSRGSGYSGPPPDLGAASFFCHSSDRHGRRRERRGSEPVASVVSFKLLQLDDRTTILGIALAVSGRAADARARRATLGGGGRPRTHVRMAEMRMLCHV